MGGQELITRLFENILFLFQHASFSRSAEYLCCNRVPLGYLCCFLFPQSTSGLQSTSVAAGSRWGTSAASFSNRVPLVCRVPLLQQGPVGVPLLLPFPTEYLWGPRGSCSSFVTPASPGARSALGWAPYLSWSGPLSRPSLGWLLRPVQRGPEPTTRRSCRS